LLHPLFNNNLIIQRYDGERERERERVLYGKEGGDRFQATCY